MQLYQAVSTFCLIAVLSITAMHQFQEPCRLLGDYDEPRPQKEKTLLPTNEPTASTLDSVSLDDDNPVDCRPLSLIAVIFDFSLKILFLICALIGLGHLMTHLASMAGIIPQPTITAPDPVTFYNTGCVEWHSNGNHNVECEMVVERLSNSAEREVLMSFWEGQLDIRVKLPRNSRVADIEEARDGETRYLIAIDSEDLGKAVPTSPTTDVWRHQKRRGFPGTLPQVTVPQNICVSVSSARTLDGRRAYTVVAEPVGAGGCRAPRPG